MTDGILQCYVKYWNISYVWLFNIQTNTISVFCIVHCLNSVFAYFSVLRLNGKTDSKSESTNHWSERKWNEKFTDYQCFAYRASGAHHNSEFIFHNSVVVMLQIFPLPFSLWTCPEAKRKKKNLSNKTAYWDKKVVFPSVFSKSEMWYCLLHQHLFEMFRCFLYYRLQIKTIHFNQKLEDMC